MTSLIVVALGKDGGLPARPRGRRPRIATLDEGAEAVLAVRAAKAGLRGRDTDAEARRCWFACLVFSNPKKVAEGLERWMEGYPIPTAGGKDRVGGAAPTRRAL